MMNKFFSIKKNSTYFFYLNLNLYPWYSIGMVGMLSLILLSLNGCASLADKYISDGLALYDSTFYKEAEEKFLLALTEDSTSEQAYFNLGRTRSRLQAYNSAVEDFSRAIELNSENSEAYLNRAIIYLQLDEKQKALIDLN